MVDNSSVDILLLLKCALSSKEQNDYHICEDPLELGCGHCVCSVCFRTATNHKAIKCNICESINTNKVQYKAPIAFKTLLNQNLEIIFQTIYDQFQSDLEKYTIVKHDVEERIDQHVDFIKDEIQIRIESIKIELDTLNEKMNEELEEIRKKWKTDSLYAYDNIFDYNLFERELKQLHENISKKQNLTEQNLYLYQDHLRFMKKVVEDMNYDEGKLSYKCSEVNIGKDLIGDMSYQNIFLVDKSILKRIRENICQTFNLGLSPLDLCVLPDGNLLMANYDAKNLLLYDQKMQLLKMVESFENIGVGVIGMDTNGYNEVYLCDWDNSKIIKTDNELNKLAEFSDWVNEEQTISQFNSPSGICFYNGFLFISDFYNKSIIKFSSNFDYVSTYLVDYSPSYIKRVNNIACVRTRSVESLYFYNLNNLSLVKKYDGHNGMIGTTVSGFFEFYCHENDVILFYYNENGETIETIENVGIKIKSGNEWNSICLFNSKLLISDRWTNTIKIV